VSAKTNADAATLFARGNTLQACGQTEAAIETFRQCLAAAPNHAGTRYNLGNALVSAGRPVEAVDSYLACLRLAPEFGPAYLNLAGALHRLGLPDQARWAAETGYRLLPDRPEAAGCLANVLHDLAVYEPAEALYRQALRVVPDHPGWLSSLGNTLRAVGRLPEALDAHERAVAAAPEDAEMRFSRAVTLLAAGDFSRGWREYEWRWMRATCRNRGPPWNGDAPGDRTILLRAEQGLGDTLQFVRYAPAVAALGGRIVLEVQPALVRLCRGLPGIAEVVPAGEAEAEPSVLFDAHCPLMSLPLLFGTTLETMPAAMPYLHADPASAAAWREQLPDAGVLRVGLCWAGARHTDDPGARLIDQRRSLPLAELAPLADIGGVQFISLQKGEAADQLLASPSGLAVVDPMPRVTDFVDTAAIVAGLDLVISVDTSVAHLAGALGRPVWLLSRYDGCWRWLHGRDGSPWYPTMRLYRQERPFDWTGVVGRLRRDLIALCESAAPGDRARLGAT
jgi:Flp pilus assembly protein TadD